MRAYLFIKVTPQDTMRLMHDLKANEHITEASLIHGPYDCVVIIHALDMEGLNKAVMQIREMKGVLETTTCLIMQSWLKSA
jgi:DNA-binding Lrp family transcriptional regulator